MKEKKNNRRPVPGLSRRDEEEQLCRVIHLAQENLDKMQKQIRQLSEELYEMYDIMEAEGTEAKENLMLLYTAQTQLRENNRDLLRCRKARKRPYFGRIDFKAQDHPEEAYYVGRVGISENTADPVVIDWRAPLASVYYENNTGRCTYTVKNEGTYEVELRNKRTYEIENDRLKDYFDSDVVANDELLTKYLAKNKTAVLGEIIATIQKEQNAVIRRSPKRNLIVQGSAGSGKTTVAMHRISYILYNYEEEFRPEDFYIIGSNRILLNYITSVLPDLDVYGVPQMTMEQLFVRLLYEDWNPEVYSIRPLDKKDQTARIKGGSDWFRDLEQFCREYENTLVSREEVRLEKNGVLLMDEAAVSRCLSENPLISVQGKINMLNNMLISRLENELTGKNVSYSQEEKKELYRRYRRHFGKKQWKGSIFELYRQFLKIQAENGKNVTFAEEKFDLYDLAALAYLYKRIKETDGIREASHVIIDEAQDFGMMAYESLSYCLRGCTYTIMGDVSQNIYYGYGLNDWEELKRLMLPTDPDGFCLLKRSYRNTVEISDFAAGILRHGSFAVYPAEPISRHGSPVCISACADEKEMLAETQKCIENWQRKGRDTIAVICRDEEEAAAVRAYLEKNITLADSDPETADFTEGVMILPVEYTKGLEFDAVLLYDPSGENYPAEDRYVKLLYVAATRALHELTAVHRGDLTDLIKKSVPLEKKLKTLEDEKVRKSAAAPEKRKMLGNRMDSECGRTQKKPALRKDSSRQPVNQSGYHFGECPDVSVLRPKNKDWLDVSVHTVKRTKKSLLLISRCGVLKLTPVEESIIRVQFRKGTDIRFRKGYWEYEPEQPVKWTARAGKKLVEMATERISVIVDKGSGALQFFAKNGNRLLAERPDQPRRIEASVSFETWNYFDWAKGEKISAKGILAEDLQRMNQKARYISFGGGKMRMPLLLSEYGYGIGTAAERTVMCCMVPMYGNYVYTDGADQIDYYFLYGGDRKQTLNLYYKITGKPPRE